ncbi:dimethylaniline monooxygenase [Sporothrix schenckii 1099-18]|uniref:L-ornithine N(5)-oxygenase n=2 Tax=Sporothrix schenckii TaxID=29908 RepID=U7Q621_SPOS1|nr:dimethylaniline monooxygenase [Sporothrix schenckii 1099-18]ERT03339.1 hypothetical protein HMPREF1624_01651 [Sporothrix schenckii ATCC 58251]KJR84223.1 dimethylaniline monooxygenase [Sporothrix schenckii 1099-18]
MGVPEKVPEKVDCTYSQFGCIGAGFAGIGLGATLKRWYGITDIRIFERHSDLGGTWHISKYPGCACDVPSALYSFSFAQNASWSQTLPPSDELWAYLKRVADTYDLPEKMVFNVTVEECRWIPETSRWRMTIRHNKAGTVFYHECQFLFGGTGQLVHPRELDVPGAETFQGAMFHTSRWRHDVDLTDKNVVLIGNGCTAAQIVPSIVGKTKHLTQIVRSKHWILPSIDDARARSMRAVASKLPHSIGTTLARLAVFIVAEIDLLGFPMTDFAARFRRRRRRQAEAYMRATAPAQYHDILVPDFEVGCKRRIFDTGYLESLHAPNLTLTNDKALEIVPEGVRTQSGVVPADVLVLANGFQTSDFLTGINVVGEGGTTLPAHWQSFGGPEAYNCTSLSGFPNFFILLGPNTATGHTSTIMAAENSINFALRIIKPLLDGEGTQVDVKRSAEEQYVHRIQDALANTVWNSGCQSWYIDRTPGKEGKKWNGMTYPYSQIHYWYRCLFPTWSHWKYSGPKTSKRRSLRTLLRLFLLGTTVSTIAAAYVALQRPEETRRLIASWKTFLPSLLKGSS